MSLTPSVSCCLIGRFKYSGKLGHGWWCSTGQEVMTCFSCAVCMKPSHCLLKSFTAGVKGLRQLINHPLFEKHLPCKLQWVLKDSHFWKAMGPSTSTTFSVWHLHLNSSLSHSVKWLTDHAFSHKPKQGIGVIPIPNLIYLFSLIYLFIGTRTLREQIVLSPRSLSRTLPFPSLNLPSAAGGGGRRWFHLSLPCVCMKEVEAVSGEQGVWDQNDDDGLTFG